MLEREIRDFVRATLAVQREYGFSLDQAKAETARMLGCELPSTVEFNSGLTPPRGIRRRGRPSRESGLSKREAVAAVAVYFETCGAGREQAITEARRWLGVSLSRKVAKEAVAAHRANTGTDQIKSQAVFAYLERRPGTTQPLPDKITFKRRPRRAKSDLG